MQNYEVTGSFVSFGIGIELKLSEDQAEIRSNSLKKKRNDIYEVVEPVHFKQGEKISISSDALSKTLLDQLQEISSEPEDDSDEEVENNGQYPRIQHVSFGRYNVFDENKNLLTSKPIKKDEAEKMLSEILAKNQTAAVDNKSQNNQEPDDNLDENKNV
jgi:hypothetical protein